ncbi:uncharacterized protein UTRI_03009 [Ustilago trichophora]|uniref:Uncharacterized protein n=1 Tax=Ustilago trichophora TaxID=86804 RepID=A0A5C3E4Q2_9BASI|nr:uncharacterized protein UTRI_03009 [Ustilago trichophora]
MATAVRTSSQPLSSATTTIPSSILEIQDHARLIDHHASHVSSNGNNTTAGDVGSATSRTLAAGIWSPPTPSHGVRGGQVHPEWINPASWPIQRGTPAYRPIDTQLEHSRRPWANTVPEVVFTFTMIGIGVQTIGLANTIFRKTVGKIEAINRFFRYQCPHEV